MATFLWPSNYLKARSAKPKQVFTYKLPSIPIDLPLVQRKADPYAVYNDASEEMFNTRELGLWAPSREEMTSTSLPVAPRLLPGEHGPGGMMKHVVQTTNHYGANYLFIRDSGKGSLSASLPTPLSQELPVCPGIKLTRRRRPYTSLQEQYLRQSRKTELNGRAKKGFKYWFDDGVRKAPLAGAPIGTEGATTGLPASVFSPSAKLMKRSTTANP